MSKSLQVLFVEDSEDDVKLLLRKLRHGEWDIVHLRVDTPTAMQVALDKQPWDLIISDYSMPRFSGPAALALARAKAMDIPFILVSGKVGEEMAVAAMKAGANDYLLKGGLNRLVPAVERELRDAEVRRNARRNELELHRREIELSLAQRQAREAAEHANHAKSEFLANMSHEIRTPMTAILGFADMMLQPKQEPADRVECIRIVQRNAAHLLELINDILDLSKIEAGRMTVERIRCDITRLLGDLISLMRPRALEKGLQLEVEFRGTIPQEIESDPMRLRQILVNLLGNAVKFTAAGRVKIVISFESAGSENVLLFEVTDTGIGLTQHQIERLFQPFTQAEESTTRKFGGTGLGLAISQQLASLLGGQITVRSKTGEGSTFSLRVNSGSLADVKMLTDLNEANLPSAPAPADWQQISLHGRILLAEDGRDNQRLLATHLRASGLEVVIAENGEIAIDLMTKSAFDLIFMDMQMPVMDGYTATAAIRKLGYTVPIIALTAYAMAEDRKKCMASGCTDYLSKPIDRELLLKTTGQYLNGTVHAVAIPASVFVPEVIAAKPSATMKSHLSSYPGMTKIIIEFVEGLPATVGQMTECLTRGDMNALRRIVHQLRGAGGGYGFDQITEPATHAEDSIRTEKSLEVITRDVDLLVAIIQQIDGFNPVETNCHAAARNA